jgi:hypothetical protein
LWQILIKIVNSSHIRNTIHNDITIKKKKKKQRKGKERKENLLKVANLGRDEGDDARPLGDAL